MALMLWCKAQPNFLPALHSQRPQQRQNNIRHGNLRLLTNSNRRFPLRNLSCNGRHRSFGPLNCSSINGYAVDSNIGRYGKEKRGDKAELLERIRGFLEFLPSVLPGGSWWSLSDELEVKMFAKPVTVWRALSRMWELVAQDRWIIFAAFSTLILSSLSEISIPHYLTASVFTAQSTQIAVFHRNVRLLVFLCVAAGISSGIRGCCFSITNMILVKRMRQSLYSALLLQDISFFDNETVGDLTSRLGSDCQQVSLVIAKDLNFILRNVIQGTGALIYLLMLSWRLGLFTLVICSTLAGVMVIYGMYQKKIAKLIQEFTASANEVAQETFSLMRTVRIYGTENLELERYKQWLEKLADISLRQSFAFGFWNLSFNVLYHSTQVIAVLIGGMYIMAGHITTEKLTKFILYSEWMIYATWWVGDNVSSLMQSIGGSEKVFQLMDLLPSDQFISKGLTLQRLTGRLEFVNVSFHYPSRTTVPVIQCVNLSVHPGEVVAIVGLSGSGKSTLVNLLLRLYEPTNGQVKKFCLCLC